jgi:hypothetical protein
VFFIQGISQGTAIPFIPSDVYCFVNVYGKCEMVSLVDVSVQEQSNFCNSMLIKVVTAVKIRHCY